MFSITHTDLNLTTETESVAQSKSIRFRKPKFSTTASPSGWVLTLMCQALRPVKLSTDSAKVLRWSKTVYKPSFSSCVYACKKITYARLRFCSPCQSLVDYGNTKITQHALKVL